jgi:hypothetical protein
MCAKRCNRDGVQATIRANAIECGDEIARGIGERAVQVEQNGGGGYPTRWMRWHGFAHGSDRRNAIK